MESFTIKSKLVESSAIDRLCLRIDDKYFASSPRLTFAPPGLQINYTGISY